MFLKTSMLVSTVVLGMAVAPTLASAATVINFETGYVDNQVLRDGEALLDSNGTASNVIISTVNDNTMSLEATGGADRGPSGFINDSLKQPDVVSPLATGSLDGFFLRSTSSLAGNFSTSKPVFTLDFLGGVSSVSAEIWDIDGTYRLGSEGWEVIATLTGGATRSILSPTFINNTDTGSLDGQAWVFEFNTAGNNILSLDFIFNGTKTRGIGVAFDNLTVATVPLPAGGMLLIAGLGALGVLRRRKRT